MCVEEALTAFLDIQVPFGVIDKKRLTGEYITVTLTSIVGTWLL